MLAAEKNYVDIVIIVPLEEELLAFQAIFPTLEDRSTATAYRHIVDVSNPLLKVLMVQQSEMGKTAASKATQEVIQDYDIGLLICLGIAGSLSGDLNLADVCYTGNIMDVYDNTKTRDNPKGGLSITFSPDYFDTPLGLSTAFNFVRTQPTLQSSYQDWQTARAKTAEELCPAPVPARNNKTHTIRAPKTMCGLIVCGSVSGSKQYNEALAQIDRKVLAIETESGGFFSVAKTHAIPAITIRGISDYADPNKGKLEEQTTGVVRTLAAQNAASFLKLQLTNPAVLDIVKRTREQRKLILPSTISALIDEHQPLDQLLLHLSEEIHHRLRELCPEYKLQAAGYKMPIPRARRREFAKSIKPESQPAEFEIRTILETQKFVVLDVPRTYPDQALPWMIANDLLTAEIEGRQVVPIVVDGNRVGPPRSGFSRVSGYEIENIQARPGVIPVIIVDDCPLSSKTRMSFVLDELDRFPNSRYLLIARGNGHLLLSTERGLQFKSELFDICDISFREMTHFIERNFQLDSLEAEVIALRLQETFSRYDLSAHPSYLATLTNSTLAALINANRRSELIQLAVDGILSFVVADDKSDVSLSRTTRSRFLQRLVTLMRVEGRSFNQAGLIDLAQSFFDEFDFELSAVSFISGFETRGILHFENGNVEISLPYVESYFLAREFMRAPDKAKRYFNLTSHDFDALTFDIYAELGPDSEVVTMIESQIDQRIDDLQTFRREGSTVLDLKGSGFEGAAFAKFQALQSQMQDAIDEVIQGKPASERKQQILDIRNQVRKSAAKEARAQTSQKVETQDDRSVALNAALTTWTAAIVLIKSAAESLPAGTKQKLSSKIITLSSSILSLWSNMNADVDFGVVRSSLTSEKHLEEFCKSHGLGEQKAIKTAVRSLMINIIDLVEEHFLSVPLLTLLTIVSQARQRVLARSLTKIHPTESVENLIHSIWLLEADPSGGEKAATDAVNRLPRSPVVRSAICGYLVATAFWNHSQPQARKHIIEVANEALRPFSERVDPKLFTT